VTIGSVPVSLASGYGSPRAAFAKASAPWECSPGEALAETGRGDDWGARLLLLMIPPHYGLPSALNPLYAKPLYWRCEFEVPISFAASSF